MAWHQLEMLQRKQVSCPGEEVEGGRCDHGHGHGVLERTWRRPSGVNALQRVPDPERRFS